MEEGMFILLMFPIEECVYVCVCVCTLYISTEYNVL